MKNMHKRLVRRFKDERGAVAALTAIFMLAMLGMCALVLDVGNWYNVRRQLQGAADAAALAGADDLPSSTSSATTDATSYATKNASGATVTVTAPYNSNNSEIKVSVSESVPSIFGKVLGISSTSVSASAVAESTSSTSGNDAIFASDSSCSDYGITFNGNGDTITGGIQANDGINFQGANSDTFGATTYGGASGCANTSTGSGDTFTSGPTKDSSNASWPASFTAPTSTQCSAGSWNGEPLTCGSSFTWQNNCGTIPSGVYYATGSIDINCSGESGNVTFIAGSFQLNGSSENFTPAYDNLLFWQTSGSLNVNGCDYDMLGTIWDPSGTITLNDNGCTNGQVLQGFLEAEDVIVDPNDVTFEGDGASSTSTGASSLVQ